jgi:thiol-disulfide isomerase/thioredoxin
MTAALVALALVAAASALGLLWRRTTGRARRIARPEADAERFSGLELGARATLVQFSSELCAPCRATARLLSGLAADGVRHVEVDVADRRDLADRFGILQTPTTLIVDGEGRVRSRIGGAPQRGTVVAELEEVLA